MMRVWVSVIVTTLVSCVPNNSVRYDAFGASASDSQGCSPLASHRIQGDRKWFDLNITPAPNSIVGPVTNATFDGLVAAINDKEQQIRTCLQAAGCESGDVSVRLRLVGNSKTGSVVDRVAVRHLVRTPAGGTLEEKAGSEECVFELLRSIALPGGGGANTFMTVMPCEC